MDFGVLEDRSSVSKTNVSAVPSSILLIEDDLMWRMIFHREMKGLAECAWIERFEDIATEMNYGSYDAVIADLGLKDASPEKTIAEIRDVSKKIPTIITSGNLHFVREVQQSKTEIRGAIYKPEFDIRIVKDWIRSGFGPLSTSNSLARSAQW